MMKNIFATLLLLAAISQTSMAQNEAKTKFNKMVSAYFDTKNGLAKDDKMLAGTGAKAMLESIQDFPMKQLDKQQQEIWQPASAALKKAAASMVNEKDLKAQRTQFKEVSYAMIKLVKGLNLNDRIIYLQHCPMAKASWLNEVEAIENPYYGSMMFDCGDVKESIEKH